jgi:hypothetical protein
MLGQVVHKKISISFNNKLMFFRYLNLVGNCNTI